MRTSAMPWFGGSGVPGRRTWPPTFPADVHSEIMFIQSIAISLSTQMFEDDHLYVLDPVSLQTVLLPLIVAPRKQIDSKISTHWENK